MSFLRGEHQGGWLKPISLKIRAVFSFDMPVLLCGDLFFQSAGDGVINSHMSSVFPSLVWIIPSVVVGKVQNQSGRMVKSLGWTNMALANTY